MGCVLVFDILGVDLECNPKRRDKQIRAVPDSQFWNHCSQEEMERRIKEMDSQRFGRDICKFN
jgi:hypothetical protein